MAVFDEKVVASWIGELDTILNQTNISSSDKKKADAVINSYLLNPFMMKNYCANSNDVMNSIANSETAMNIVANSETAMNIVANSETAMNSIWNSPYRWTYFDSSYIDTVYDNSSTARSILRNILLNNPDIFGDNSIVAYYPFEGNANDYSGNGYNGTWSGTEQYDTGWMGQAAKFDGSSYIKIPINLNVSPGTISVSLWINVPDVINRQTFFDILDTATDPSNYWHSLILRVENGQFVSDFENPNGTANLTTFGSVIANTYYHIVISYKTDGNLYHYVDSSLIQARDGTGLSVSTNDYCLLGVDIAPTWVTYNLLTGLIDSFRIFNRALTDTEVQRLYKLEYLARN